MPVQFSVLMAGHACTVLCPYGRPCLYSFVLLWPAAACCANYVDHAYYIIIIGSSFHSLAAKRLGYVEHCPGCFKESSDSLTVPQC